MDVLIEMTCDNKKTTESAYSTGKDIVSTKTTSIELNIPHDSSNVFYRLSGGTVLNLNTVNEEAAAMFTPGKKYKYHIIIYTNKNIKWLLVK